MLGYKYKDVLNMFISIEKAEFYLPPSNDEVREGLKQVSDFLEGLISEGYIND